MRASTSSIDQSWFVPGVVTASMGVAILKTPRFWSSSDLDIFFPEHSVSGQFPLRYKRDDVEGWMAGFGSLLFFVLYLLPLSVFFFGVAGDLTAGAAVKGAAAGAAGAFVDVFVVVVLGAAAVVLAAEVAFFFGGLPPHDWESTIDTRHTKSAHARRILVLAIIFDRDPQLVVTGPNYCSVG